MILKASIRVKTSIKMSDGDMGSLMYAAIVTRATLVSFVPQSGDRWNKGTLTYNLVEVTLEIHPDLIDTFEMIAKAKTAVVKPIYN